MKFKLLSTIVIGILLTGCNGESTPAQDTSQPTNSYDVGLRHVQELFLLKEGERSGSDYKTFFDRIQTDAMKYSDTISFDNEHELWADLPNADSDSANESINIHLAAKRFKTMSQAYITPGPLYLDKKLFETISIGLDYYLSRYYQGAQTGSWYEWQIGVPQELMQVTANMHGYLSPSLEKRMVDAVNTYIISIDDINPFPFPGLSTGANRVDMAWAKLVAGFAGKNIEDIAEAKEAFFDSDFNRYALSPNADTGSAGAYRYGTIDSFKRDGGYLFHADLPYSNGYGADLLNRAAEMLIILNGTEFDFSQKEKDEILSDAFSRLETAWMPWLRDGIGLDAAAGRAVFRGFEQNQGKGKWGIEGILKYYILADAGSNPVQNSQRKSLVAKFAKSFLTNSSNFFSQYSPNSDEIIKNSIEYYATTAESIKLANTILADSSVSYVKDPMLGNLMYAEIDRVVHRTNDFAFVVAAHSSRIGNYEIIGGEGSRGCYSGDGMTYIYDGDLNQYIDYWVAFDADRPAGVTNDASSPEDQKLCAWSTNTGSYRKGNMNWTGGVSAGKDGFGIFGMDYKDWHWEGSRKTPTPFVEAHKSWFMFGDAILALGSDIKCNSGCDRSKLETTIDNRKINQNSNASVLIDGKTWNGNSSYTNVSAMHISDNGSNSQIGIVFPNKHSVNIIKERRSGDWKYLSNRGAKLMESTYVEADFLRTSFKHSDEGDNTYAYILLPVKSSAQTMEYAANPTLEIIENSVDMHAVRNIPNDVFAANIFAAPSDEYKSESAKILLAAFASNEYRNRQLNESEVKTLFDLAANEILYGDSNYIKATGEVSIMSKLNGDELTVWISQPSREVMTAVVDISGAKKSFVNILDGQNNVTLSQDGKRALVRFDVIYNGAPDLGTKTGATGITYKFKFKVTDSNF